MITIEIASLLLFYIVILSGCGGSGTASPSASDPVVSGDNTSITADGSGAMLAQDTELSTGFSGLAVKNAFIIDGNDRMVSKRDVALNTQFSIVYEGVKNYTLKNGKAFPDLSIRVMDNNQVTVLEKADMLASYTDGLSETDASVLRATVVVGDPMKAGKYICTVQVIDKNNANAAILSTWEFEVK